MSPIQIRTAAANDAAAIASVLHESFAGYQAAYSPAAFMATTPSSDQIQHRLHEGPVWVAIRNDMIVGAISAVPQGAALYLRSLAVLPLARGLGIGGLLIQQAEQFAAAHDFLQLVLSTTPFLTHAIQLYSNPT